MRTGERMQILNRLDAGVITVDEAVQLLTGLPRPARPLPAWKPGRPWRVIVRVWDGGRRVINLWLPIVLVAWGMRLFQRFGKSEALNALDVGQLRRAVAAGGRGPVVDLEDGGDRIYIEFA